MWEGLEMKQAKMAVRIALSSPHQHDPSKIMIQLASVGYL